MSNYLTHLPPPMAMLLWDKVEPLLMRAVAQANGEFTRDDLEAMVRSGRMVVILIMQGEEIKAAAGVESINYPAKRSLRVTLLGGGGWQEWGQDLVGYIDTLAASWALDDIELAGRAGWARELTKYGYNQAYTVMTRKVGEDE